MKDTDVARLIAAEEARQQHTINTARATLATATTAGRLIPMRSSSWPLTVQKHSLQLTTPTYSHIAAPKPTRPSTMPGSNPVIRC